MHTQGVLHTCSSLKALLPEKNDLRRSHMRIRDRRGTLTSTTVKEMNPMIAVKTSRRTIGFKPKKHGYLRLSVHRPHKHRAPVFCGLAKGVPSADGAGHRRFQHALTTCSYHSPTGRIYAVWEERMSESPASMMAMVEQRKSLPQAVPSSICITEKVQVSRKWTLQRLLRVA